MFPENPSERGQTFYKCSYCNVVFFIKEEYLQHLEECRHRICYKCGQNCGGMKEFMEGKFIAEKIIEGNVETYKYRHVICPKINPTKRFEYVKDRQI